MAAVSANAANQAAVLKELYIDDQSFMKDLVYKNNPFLGLVPKDEDPESFGGKYLPVPIEFGVPQGRANTFNNALSQQTPTQNASFFVSVIRDYQLITLDNLYMEQSKGSAAAFVDGIKHEMDGGIRNITNNLAFSLFNDGTGTRGFIAASSNVSGLVYNITLSNPQSVVNFEQGMTLDNFTCAFSASGRQIVSISALSSTTALVNKVDRTNGILNVTLSGSDSSWTTVGQGLGVAGDTQNGNVLFQYANTGSMLALCGLKAWIPYDAPATGDNFWGVDRSADPTRLGGLRYDASGYTIEEGIINALALADRESASPDLIIIDQASYASLVNQMGAKVMYTRAEHDEVEVGYDGILFQGNNGIVTVLSDRSCPAQTAFILTLNTWKLRTLGKAPKILTYGLEGLEGLRVGDMDALQVRLAYYGNLTCSAPGWNMIVSLSA